MRNSKSNIPASRGGTRVGKEVDTFGTISPIGSMVSLAFSPTLISNIPSSQPLPKVRFTSHPRVGQPDDLALANLEFKGRLLFLSADVGVEDLAVLEHAGVTALVRAIPATLTYRTETLSPRWGKLVLSPFLMVCFL
jgi:hypothetical protein